MTYDKEFKESALKLSDKIEVKKSAEQPGLPYYTIAKIVEKLNEIRQMRHCGSGHRRIYADLQEHRIKELEKENIELH